MKINCKTAQIDYIKRGEVSAMQCQRGCEINTEEISDDFDLTDYSACDCCGDWMHHSSVGCGYFVMIDGRTLCNTCVRTEDPNDVDDENQDLEDSN